MDADGGGGVEDLGDRRGRRPRGWCRRR